MCGICGQYSFYGELVLEERILKMMNSIVHRGPDDSGFYVSRQIGLGFRRLSIIDLSDGHQPMSDNEKRIWVVFNGEIYNFRELRTELEKKGHRFLTSSDTEVIVYGYKQWGADVLNRLNGMFGLAIWDTAQNRLIIARDPMGIKPVYYCNTGSDLFFGSEIRPIIAALGTCPEVDSVSLNLFLRYRYTPSPGTLYKDVFKLAAGEMIEVVNGKMDKRRWYNYVPTLFEKAPSITDAEEELFCLYRNAVKRQLISDVPVGILLSGGVDSGLLLALMSENGKNWPTFTVGYGKSYKDDELIDAKETADFYGASNEAVLIDRETFELELPQIISCLEEPVASSSVVPMYFVCQKARQDVKVALIGQGPDELFGGYSRHLGAQYGYILRRMPQIFQSIVSNLIYTLPRNEALKRAVSSLGTKDKFQRYRNIFSLLPGDTIN
ncbi:MAG: asparagine synthase (glutamine-hydrolyzing), partial [Fibrobacter sp.]|nr:asparagine synthase (glutamine-hydrolyzing) [Fibrobacter sp.]